MIPETTGFGRATADERIGRAVERLEAALEHKAGFGRSTATSTTVLGEGLRCVTTEGEHLIEADLPTGLGGDGSGPNPGALIRAALGSCLAQGYRLRAARHGVAVAGIEVTVETDSDIAGLIDMQSSIPAGFCEIRYRVRIRSDAPPAQLEALVAEADEHSPMLDALGRANPLARSIEIVSGGG